MSSSSSPYPKRCAIVGAGACGLACARWALAYGFRPVVLERRPNLGGLWRYTVDPLPDELATVMRCTVTNSSKEMTAFSDFPPDAQMPNYMRHDKMLTYLEAYVRHHQLEQYIQFGQKVTQICRSPNYAKTGQWTVQWENGNGEQTEEVAFHCVLVAVGHHAKPNVPNWHGFERFRGKVVHSHDFRCPTPDMEQKVNVVVGAGDSAVDMAVELSRVSKEVLLSTRRGFWVLRKCSIGGLPVDTVLTTRFNSLLFRYAPRCFNEWRLIRFLQNGLDHAMYGLMPTISPLVSQFFTVNDELPGRMLAGLVTIKPDIEHFTENGIVWVDGTRTDRVDNVLLGTGYRFDFGLIERGQLLVPVQMDNNDNENSLAPLYKHMFPLATADWHTLAIVGIVQPTGSKLCVAEMQARLFFEVQCGSVKVPSADEMRRELLATAQIKEPMRHAYEVDYIGYMDDLASLVGCMPSLCLLLFTGRFRLFRAVLFGPNVAYVYRLRGPHRWPCAERAVLGVPERMWQCMGTRREWHKMMGMSNDAGGMAQSLSRTAIIGTIIIAILVAFAVAIGTHLC